MDPVTKVILSMAIFILSLVGIIVTVGLLQSTLSPTGAVTVLMGAFTGLISGFYFRSKGTHDE